MGRAPCCDKANVKRGPWSPEEDETLRSYIQKHGSSGNWIALPKKAGLRRCGKSCRLRWLNYLRPDIKHGGFTEEEDNVIWSLYNKIGSRWSVIAAQLQGRTDNDVKNYWNTKLKKKRMPAPTPQKDRHQHQQQQAILTMSSPTSTTSTTINTPSPSPPLAPLLIPSVKTETYTCDDFLAPTLTGSTNGGGATPAGLGFGFNLDFNNYQSLLLDNNNCGFLFEELLGAFCSNNSSPYETKPSHGCS